jgi:hypothetical protein
VKALDQRLPAIHHEGPILKGCHPRTALRGRGGHNRFAAWVDPPHPRGGTNHRLSEKVGQAGAVISPIQQRIFPIYSRSREPGIERPKHPIGALLGLEGACCGAIPGRSVRSRSAACPGRGAVCSVQVFVQASWLISSGPV